MPWYVIHQITNSIRGPFDTLGSAKFIYGEEFDESAKIVCTLNTYEKLAEDLTAKINEKDAELTKCRQALAQIEQERQSLAVVLIPAMLEVLMNDTESLVKLKDALRVEDVDEDQIVEKASDMAFNRITDTLYEGREFDDAVADVVSSMSFEINVRNY